jgi:hypothetical protein
MPSLRGNGVPEYPAGALKVMDASLDDFGGFN